MEQSALKTTTSVGRLDLADRVVAYLRSKHPAKTAEHVAADTGLKLSTVKRLLERHSAPSACALYMLTAAYGAAFLHAVFGFEWLSTAATEQKAERLEASIAKQRAELDQLRSEAA